MEEQQFNPNAPNFNDENLAWLREPIQPEKTTFRPVYLAQKGNGLGVEKYESTLQNLTNEGDHGEFFPAANMD